MSQPPIIFPAAFTAKKRISRNAYILFGVGVALLACGLVTGAISFTPDGEPPPVLLTAAIGLACTGMGGLIAGLATLARIRRKQQVEVTPHRLIWREGNKSATLEFEEVVRVELLRADKQVSDEFTLGYPVVRFIEDDGEMMEFEASFTDRGYTHKAKFDTRSITREVLAYVGGRADVSPAVEDFVNMGEVDIDTLPAQNP